MGDTHRHRPAHLARKLRLIRTRLGLTQPELIKQLQTKEPLYPASISQYESGKREPSLLVVWSYAKLAGVSVESLIDDGAELPLKRCKKIAV
jgi:transcriptional regulator with XRE-family HTH domain